MVETEKARQLALSLPEATTDDGKGFAVGQKGFAWFYSEKVPGRPGRILHDDVLAVRVMNLDEKDALIASEPDKFFTDAHYNGYPAVLVRLDAVEPDELKDLLIGAWRIRAPKKLQKQFESTLIPTIPAGIAGDENG